MYYYLIPNFLLIFVCYIYRLDTNAKTTWHINPNQTAEVEEQTAKQGQNLMAVAAKRVWEELYISKKPAIEEVNYFSFVFFTYNKCIWFTY